MAGEVTTDWESTVRQAINLGNEGLHIEFKGAFTNSAEDAAWIAKHVIAIANTDEPQRIGLLILGAARRRIVGKIDAIATDQGAAAAENRILSFIEPSPPVELHHFEDPTAGPFGALVIHPQPDGRPYVAKKDGRIDDSEFLRAGDIYLRRGSSTQRATRDDIERWYRRRYLVDEDKPELHLCWTTGVPVSRIQISRPYFDADLSQRIDTRSVIFPSNKDYASRVNRTVWIPLTIRNTGKSVGRNIIIDIHIRGPIDEILLEHDKPRMNFVPPGNFSKPTPQRPVHTDIVRRIDGGGFQLRQRLANLNPGVLERLVPFGVLGPSESSDAHGESAFEFNIEFSVYDESGQKPTGKMHVSFYHDGDSVRADADEIRLLIRDRTRVELE